MPVRAKNDKTKQKILEILAFLVQFSFDLKDVLHKPFLPSPDLKMVTQEVSREKKNFLVFQTLYERKKLLHMFRKSLHTCRSKNGKNKNFTFQHCIISSPPFYLCYFWYKGGYLLCKIWKIYIPGTGIYSP